VRIGEIASYWQKPTVGPVVQIDTPRAVDMIRRRYPYDHPTFTTNWEAMSGMEAIRLDAPAMLIGAATALAIGMMNFKGIRSPFGVLGLGAAGSIMGSVIYNFIKDAAE
jgi:hypothetical protein